LPTSKRVEILDSAEAAAGKLETARRRIAALERPNGRPRDKLLSVAAETDDRSVEDRGKPINESQRKGALKKRTAIKGSVALRPLTKLIHVPAARSSGSLRGRQKREVRQKLMVFFEARYDGGCMGNTGVQLMSGFFDDNPDVFDLICD
jgi:hypothetical protein